MGSERTGLCVRALRRKGQGLGGRGDGDQSKSVVTTLKMAAPSRPQPNHKGRFIICNYTQFSVLSTY